MDTATILSHVDHTLLKPESTWEQIKTLCDEAMEFGCATVCIPPSFVKQAAAYVQGNLKIWHRHRLPQRLLHHCGESL